VSGNVHPSSSLRLSSRARHFLSSRAASDQRLFRIDQAYTFWRSKAVARQALSRLVRAGWLERVERGLYLVIPLEAGPEGRWSEDPKAVAAHLAPRGAVAYWSSLHYWGMTEQIPRVLFVQSPTRRHVSRVSRLGVDYRFILVAKRKFFGVIRQSSAGAAFQVTDREKTLIDALDRPDLCGGMPLIVDALSRSLEFDWDHLDRYLARFASGAVYKRLGYLGEFLALDIPRASQRLEAWRRRCSQGVALLDPRGLRRGAISSRWRVRVNVTGLGAGR
jgi:predicted transcriptional regulator of viral defense system